MDASGNEDTLHKQAVERYMSELLQREEEIREKDKKDHEALLQKVTDFWSGNGVVDPSLERFDTTGKVSIRIKRDIWGGGEDETSWLKVYKAVIEAQDGRKLGSFTYRVINVATLHREMGYFNMHDVFHVSERAGQEVESLGQMLFDKQGRPDPRFFAGGNGKFGPEIALENFAVLCGDEPGEEYFQVKEDFRRRGVGTQAVKLLFEHKSLQNVQTLFVWPSVNGFPCSLEGTQVEEKAMTAIFKFFAGAGFRHVGSGPVMAYILHNANHPSRLLAAGDDLPMKYQPAPRLGDFLAALQGA